MPRYKIITLVDITKTGATKTQGTEMQLKQQSNFNSLRQATELRSNIFWHTDPKKHNGQLPEHLDGKCIYWHWEFEVEQLDIFLENNNPVKLLLDDLHGVPVINNLTNSETISPAIIQTHGNTINTWVFLIY